LPPRIDPIIGQARGRIAQTLPPKAGGQRGQRGQRVEHTYERNGALAYLATGTSGIVA
jgi:hypothetical protein